MKTIGLYIHIPFCAKKCNYCDFTSYVGVQEHMTAYVDAVLQEMSSRREKIKDYCVTTIFIGGGTPTYLHDGLVFRIMEGCRRFFCIDTRAEITLEGNPGTFTRQKLEEWKKAGINRLSMGLQACQPHHLQKLGRIHSYEEFEENFHQARELLFDNINVDLMFGLPDQTLDEWRETIRKVTDLRPEHLSCYSLKVEEGTPFHHLQLKGNLALPDDNDERIMYWQCVRDLSQRGYHQYEISNFALDGRECRHNINYWMNGEYIGIGCAAHSCIGNMRFANDADLFTYIRKVEQGQDPVVFMHQESGDDMIFETIMLGLRLTEGINLTQFRDRFHFSLLEAYKREIAFLVEKGFLEIGENSLRLTSRGVDLQNQVLLYFMKDSPT